MPLMAGKRFFSDRNVSFVPNRPEIWVKFQFHIFHFEFNTKNFIYCLEIKTFGCY